MTGMRNLRIRTLTLIALIAIALAATGYGLASVISSRTEVRVVLRAHEDGRLEVGVLHDGELLQPELRFVAPERAEALAGRWLRSSPVSLSVAVGPEQGPEPLRIGFLGDFSEPGGDEDLILLEAVRLAVRHANEAGGVFGRPVEVVVGNTGFGADGAMAAAEARRLIEEEGAHALVGPMTSGQTLRVVEMVSGPAGIPTITPSGTSPRLSEANDDDYLFRSTASDAAQGPVLAELAGEAGAEQVAILYFEGAYGEGLRDAFKDAFTGSTAEVVMNDESDPQVVLESLAAINAETSTDTLLIILPVRLAELVLTRVEAAAGFSRFLFTDSTRSMRLLDDLGAELLEGMSGTAPSGGHTQALQAWQGAWLDVHGELPARPFAPEAYDAAAAIILAAAAADSTDGAAIRDQLRRVTDAEGSVVIPGAAGIGGGLALLRQGKAINYEGAESTLDWNADGDLTTGRIGIWRFEGGEIVDIRSIPFTFAP